ncbi:hypothetical protein BXQ17_07190 [Polaribacter sp. BM10]|uniref:hypothetical protein n=1 Tax=Polaribacter sp. BM10 TaxID=1529069 RepID=UPI0009BC811C|nr:hypothetical protein [Polaribacter sp. BM10]AQS95253.1 hypothetical protein BXQ17_07190 [Polaribacter sp. BM10]
MKNFINLAFLLLLFVFPVSGQELLEGQKRWSATEKLSLEDYSIKKNYNDAILSQFLISYESKGFDFFKKNLNSRVENIFIGKGSYIDITKINNLEKQLEFQQLQFDLAEIQARKFRKRLFLGKKKLVKGFEVMKLISNEISNEFAEIRMRFINETNSGNNLKVLEVWKSKVKSELNELNEFRFENRKKIKKRN